MTRLLCRKVTGSVVFISFCYRCPPSPVSHEKVTVYGEKGTEAERLFAKAAGFRFVDLDEGPSGPVRPPVPPQPPVELPLVRR